MTKPLECKCYCHTRERGTVQGCVHCLPKPTTESVVHYECSKSCRDPQLILLEGGCKAHYIHQPTTDEWGDTFKIFYDDNESGGSSRWLVTPDTVKNFITTHFLPISKVREVIEWMKTEKHKDNPDHHKEELYCCLECKEDEQKIKTLTDLKNNLGL